MKKYTGNQLTERCIQLPDRRGNNRLDSLRNIILNPAVGIIFLVPGVGAQGATPAEGLASADANGLGALVVASRSLLFPKGEDRDATYDENRDGVMRSVLNATKSLKKTWCALSVRGMSPMS